MRTQLVALHGGQSPIVLKAVLAVLLTQTYAFAQVAPAAPAAAPGATETAPTAGTAERAPTAAPQQPSTPAAVEAASAAAPVAGAPAASGTQQPTAPAAAAASAEAAPAPSEASAQADQSAAEVAEDLSNEGGKVNIYGFADFTYTQLLSSRHAMNATTFPYGSFYVGNLNLYLSTDLGHKWRTLSEVRFTYLPDGAENFSTNNGTPTYTRTSTVYPDYTDYNRNVKVGGVIIERAWIEYAAHPLLTIRGGQFLTPYGIWNVEHGTTVIVGTTRPFIIGAEMFPAHQTGLEAYGTYAIESTQVGYHVTLSNGRGPVDEFRDLDKNKAVGWRLWVQQDTDFGTFVLGTSGYKGRYTDRGQTTSIINSQIVNDYPVNSEYRELSLALDLKWTWKGALFQSEAIMHDTVYENNSRPAAFVMDGGPQGGTPDNRQYGFYALAGYRLPWFGIMPYFGGEYYYLGRTTFSPDALAFWGGLNIRPTDRVVLKIQGAHAVFPTGWIGMQAPSALHQLITQVAWSF